MKVPYTLVLAGSLLRHPGSRSMVDALLAEVPGARPVRATREPAVGALLLAYDRVGTSPDLARVDGSVPTGMFETRPEPRGLLDPW